MKFYPWTRYWSPTDKEIATSSNGYLPDPTGWGQVLNPCLLRTDDLCASTCLILLGEPGIGKSFEMRRLYEIEKSSADGFGNTCLLFEGKDYSSEQSIIEYIFKHPEFQKWRNGQNKITLFFDGLDESQLMIPNILAILVRELQGSPVDRLRLRIACRASLLPPEMDETLSRLWPYRHDTVGKHESQEEKDASQKTIKQFKLAPLTENDILIAARCEEIQPPENFIDEITATDVGPLAANPVTLRFLLDVFKGGESLRVSKSELYWKGCLKLCEEKSISRRQSNLTGKLTPHDRLAIASRIAYLMLFGGFGSINVSDIQDFKESGIFNCQQICSNDVETIGQSS